MNRFAAAAHIAAALRRSDVLADDAELRAVIAAGGSRRIQTLNAHHLALALRSSAMLAFLRSADHLTADGWPVVLLARQVGKRVRRVTGSDLVESITRGAHGPLRIALLGAQEDVGDRWAGALARAGSSLVLREHGATADWDLRSLAARLNALAPDLVLVAVTPPRGEFVSAGLQAAGLLSPVVAVGGAIDMVTGTRRRAPGWAQRAGLEWLVRLVQEPRRLFVRYVLQSGPAGALVWLAAVAGPLEPQPSGGPSRVARTDRDRVG